MSPTGDDPAQVWAALAPLLAGQPRVRLSRDGGKSYPQRHERALTETLPTVPAAVRIFGKDGSCSAIFLDFDSAVAGTDWVEADVRAVQTWLHRCGARWIEDHSPSGGRHVYVPLAERVTFTQARDLVEALGTRLRTLDKTPHQNLLHGCMRPPGSVHKRGGHQQLAMSLSTAYDILRRPNSAAVWATMTADLAAEIEAVRALRREADTPAAVQAPAETTDQPAGRMSRAMHRIATTGVYDTSRYATDSEARQAVLAGAAAAGLTATDVDRRMKQGLWPGLASFYARYAARHRTTAFQRDWRNASAHIQKQRSGSANDNARRSPTSRPNTQAGVTDAFNSNFSPDAEHRFIRTWRSALALAEPRYKESRNGMARRMVLRALGEAAHKTASRFIEFGDRALAVATGLDHTTVGAHLRELRSEKDALVTLIESGRGTRGDLYMLTIPGPLEDPASSLSWRKGKIHGLRPAFRELGLPAAFVYEALESAATPLPTAELVRKTRLSRTAVSEALEILAAWGLAERDSSRSWLLGRASLQLLAEQLGVLEAVAAQLARYRVERANWHEWLAGRRETEQLLPDPDEDYPWEAFEGPPQDWTLADLAFH